MSHQIRFCGPVYVARSYDSKLVDRVEEAMKRHMRIRGYVVEFSQFDFDADPDEVWVEVSLIGPITGFDQCFKKMDQKCSRLIYNSEVGRIVIGLPKTLSIFNSETMSFCYKRIE